MTKYMTVDEFDQAQKEYESAAAAFKASGKVANEFGIQILIPSNEPPDPALVYRTATIMGQIIGNARFRLRGYEQHDWLISNLTDEDSLCGAGFLKVLFIMSFVDDRKWNSDEYREWHSFAPVFTTHPDGDILRDNRSEYGDMVASAEREVLAAITSGFAPLGWEVG